MRDGSGFDLLEQLTDRDLAVIFTTAYDHFAVRAFEVCAVDYVLKPISVARLRDALDRARARLEANDAAGQLAELRSAVGELRRQLGEQNEKETEFWVRGASGSLVRVLAGDIEWIKSEDDYVRLHTRTASHLLRGSIRSAMAELDAADFIRVHRNALVRRASIKALHRRSLGSIEVELYSGARIPAGRVYAKQLRAGL